MTDLVAPLYTGTINGHPVRFFKAPLPDPHIPWHVVEEAMTLSPIDLPREIQKRRNSNAEARVQSAIVEWIRLIAPDALVFAIPNGGLRSKSEAARMKWTGTVAGIPDLCLIVPSGKVHFIEVKAPGGHPSREQTQILLRLVRLGVECLVARSIDDVRQAFGRWGIKTREVAA